MSGGTQVFRVMFGISLLLLFCVRISLGANYWVQVTNRTDYYLHIKINGRSYLYIAPGSYARDNFETREISILVVYAPGQAINGKIVRDFKAEGTSGPACEEDVICNGGPPLNVHWIVNEEDFNAVD